MNNPIHNAVTILFLGKQAFKLKFTLTTLVEAYKVYIIAKYEGLDKKLINKYDITESYFKNRK